MEAPTDDIITNNTFKSKKNTGLTWPHIFLATWSMMWLTVPGEAFLCVWVARNLTERRLWKTTNFWALVASLSDSRWLRVIKQGVERLAPMDTSPSNWMISFILESFAIHGNIMEHLLTSSEFILIYRHGMWHGMLNGMPLVTVAEGDHEYHGLCFWHSWWVE